MVAAPCVDVGVVTWNTAELTASALRKLLEADDHGVVGSVLVHDNASTDGTPELLAEEVPEAEVEVCAANLGFAAGVNRLIQRSTSPWLLLVNSDAWPEEGALSALVAAGERLAGAAAIAPRLAGPDGAVEESTHPFPSVGVAAASALGLRRLVQWDHDEARCVDWAMGAVLLLRRAALEDVGGFDERYFMYSEDMDWCLRARRRGWDIWYEPSSTFTHVGNASGVQRFGGERDRVVIANACRFYSSTHGRASTALWRMLNAVGTARLSVTCRIRGDREAAAAWRSQAGAYLGR